MTTKEKLHIADSNSGTDVARAFAEAVQQLSIYAGDPLGGAEKIIAEEPQFVMAHVLKAWLYLLGTDAKAASAARGIIAHTDGLAVTRREQGHIAAIRKLADGEYHAASRIMEDVNVENPRDLLGLIAGHQIDFFTGNSRMLRDRIARAQPNWRADMPGYHSVLSMHAFGLEEMGDYARAEAKGREALSLERRDGWAKHAVAHVMEMQGRHDEGVAFLRDDIDGWTKDSFFAVHNWWHLALYHLELGQFEEVLKLADGPITSPVQDQIMNLIDASALLWRLQLRGVDVGDRWSKLVKRYEVMWTPGYYAFNDLHAAMAFLGAGRQDLIEATLAAQAEVKGDNVMFSFSVGLPLINAFIAFYKGSYADAVALMRPVRGIAARFGGSHAQRDVIDLTLLEAAIRTGNMELAQALSAERALAKHDSPLVSLVSKRIRPRDAARDFHDNILQTG
jgi:tetratricopeptide (TPR) repeat protein